jgi:hypothetical protein
MRRPLRDGNCRNSWIFGMLNWQLLLRRRFDHFAQAHDIAGFIVSKDHASGFTAGRRTECRNHASEVQSIASVIRVRCRITLVDDVKKRNPVDGRRLYTRPYRPCPIPLPIPLQMQTADKHPANLAFLGGALASTRLWRRLYLCHPPDFSRLYTIGIDKRRTASS